jgi:glutaredoxin 3
MKYVVFSKATCPFCVRVKEILEDKNLDHHIINFDEDQQEILQELKLASSWDTVPMVFQVSANGVIKFIGGCSDLERCLSV